MSETAPLNLCHVCSNISDRRRCYVLTCFGLSSENASGGTLPCELSKILAMKSYVASFSLRGAYAWLTLSKFWLTRREFSQDAYAKLTQKSFHQFGQPQYNESLRKVSDLLCRSLFTVGGGRKRRRMRLTEYMRHRPEKAQEEIHDGD